MNKLLFHVLHSIHRQKKQRTVAFLIYNLYKPILWRYLQASNGFVRFHILVSSGTLNWLSYKQVRANALCLFFDSFPFESGEGIEEDQVLRNKQWGIIQTALMDPVPLVRSIAVQVKLFSYFNSITFLFLHYIYFIFMYCYILIILSIFAKTVLCSFK